MANAFITRRAGTLVKNIANAEVTLDFSSVTYDGSQHAPKIQNVTMDGEPLTNLLHYYATITPQTDAGDYYVIVHGLGEYGGVKQVPWSIGKAQGSVSVEPDSITIQGELGTTGQVIITYEGDGELSISESSIVSAQILGYDPVLENNSWETIAQVAAAGMASKAWNLGDTKTIELNGSTYHAQIIDFDHDDIDATDSKYGDSSYNGGSDKAAITFQMVELFDTNYPMNNSNTNNGGWKSSIMRTSTMPIIKEYMLQDIQSNLRTVSKASTKGNESTIIEKIADEVFLPAYCEIFSTTSAGYKDEGVRYAYWAANIPDRKNKLDGTKFYWWFRSPEVTSSTDFIYLYWKSSYSYGSANGLYGIAPCFCL